MPCQTAGASRADYDYILVDTGPSLGSLTINAFTAADEIIIPIDPELFALVGLKELTETISKIKQKLNPRGGDHRHPVHEMQ